MRDAGEWLDNVNRRAERAVFGADRDADGPDGEMARLHKRIIEDLHRFASPTGCPVGGDIIQHFAAVTNRLKDWWIECAKTEPR